MRPAPGLYEDAPQHKHFVTTEINTWPMIKKTQAAAESPVETSLVYEQVRYPGALNTADACTNNRASLNCFWIQAKLVHQE